MSNFYGESEENVLNADNIPSLRYVLRSHAIRDLLHYSKNGTWLIRHSSFQNVFLNYRDSITIVDQIRSENVNDMESNESEEINNINRFIALTYLKKDTSRCIINHLMLAVSKGGYYLSNYKSNYNNNYILYLTRKYSNLDEVLSDFDLLKEDEYSYKDIGLQYLSNLRSEDYVVVKE